MTRCNHFAMAFAAAAFSLATAANGGVVLIEDQDIAAWPGTPTFSSTSLPTAGTSGEAIQTDRLIGQTFAVVAETAGTLDKVHVTYSTAAGVVNQSYQLLLQEVDDPNSSYEVGTNLFGNLVFTLTVDTSDGGTLIGTNARQVLTFDLTGSDEVTLVAGTNYAFEIVSTTTSSGADFSWWRTSSGGNQDPDGSAFLATSAVDMRDRAAGGADLGFAYTVVPEPASLAMLGLGSLLILRRRRSA